MKILFKGEKYKDETIKILTQLLTDANLSGDNQVMLQLKNAQSTNLQV